MSADLITAGGDLAELLAAEISDGPPITSLRRRACPFPRGSEIPPHAWPIGWKRWRWRTRPVSLAPWRRNPA